MIPSHPSWTGKFRLGTSRVSMAGVMSPTFRCAKCRNYRQTSGRKKIGAGYQCAKCAAGGNCG